MDGTEEPAVVAQFNENLMSRLDPCTVSFGTFPPMEYSASLPWAM